MRELILSIIAVLAFVGAAILFLLALGIAGEAIDQVMIIFAKIPYWILTIASIVFMVILFRRDKD